MKTAFRNTVALITLSRSINPHSHFRSLLPHFSVAAVSSSPPLLFSLAKPETFRFRRVFSSQRHSSMTGGEAHAPMSMEKQFEDFRVQLEEAGNLRERIRAVVMEIESTTRLMYASFLLVHQSRPLSGNQISYYIALCLVFVWFILLLLVLFHFDVNGPKLFWIMSLLTFFRPNKKTKEQDEQERIAGVVWEIYDKLIE